MVKLIFCEQANGGEALRFMGVSQKDPSLAQKVSVLFTSLKLFNNFLLTGISIRANSKPKARRNAPPKGGHYEGRGLWIRPYKYSSQLVRNLLSD